jgi:hypothetical protein
LTAPFSGFELDELHAPFSPTAAIAASDIEKAQQYSGNLCDQSVKTPLIQEDKGQ